MASKIGFVLAALILSHWLTAGLDNIVEPNPREDVICQETSPTQKIDVCYGRPYNKE